MSTTLNGYEIRVTDATIEAFLAVYGDRMRYPNDDATARRRDVRHAVKRLRLLPSDSGGVMVTATRTASSAELNIIGFLEVYERNSEPFSGSDCRDAMHRLVHALPCFIADLAE